MDLQYIPKYFWLSLSVAILALSGGFVYATILSTSATLEIAGMKITLDKAKNELTTTANELSSTAASLKQKATVLASREEDIAAKQKAFAEASKMAIAEAGKTANGGAADILKSLENKFLTPKIEIVPPGTIPSLAFDIKSLDEKKAQLNAVQNTLQSVKPML